MDKMPKVILPIILALVLFLTGCQATSQPSPGASPTPPPTSPTRFSVGVGLGNLAPDFTLKNLEGQDISLSSLRGKPVLINFWATWCPPCREEMPYLQQIYEEWSGEGLMLLAVDIGESPALVKEFLETHNFSMPVLLDTERIVSEKYNITAIPTTFFIDRDGIIRGKRIGAFSNKEEIEGYLGKIIP